MVMRQRLYVVRISTTDDVATYLADESASFVGDSHVRQKHQVGGVRPTRRSDPAAYLFRYNRRCQYRIDHRPTEGRKKRDHPILLTANLASPYLNRTRMGTEPV
jgi:hypothetical protein